MNYKEILAAMADEHLFAKERAQFDTILAKLYDDELKTLYVIVSSAYEDGKAVGIEMVHDGTA